MLRELVLLALVLLRFICVPEFLTRRLALLACIMNRKGRSMVTYDDDGAVLVSWGNAWFEVVGV